jgi:hypothetical protein
VPKAALAQTGFNTGEISPLCYGVFDNPRYKKGLQIGLNYLPTLQGPIIRRPGTKYVTNVKDSSNPPVLIPFSFSATQNYMLEFGANYIRFYANNSVVVNPAASVRLSGTIGNTGILSIFGFNFYATRANANPQPYEATVSTTTAVAAGAILELPSPYIAADVALLRWTQNGDTLYLVHPNYPPYKLQRQSQIAWKLQRVFILDGPYLPANSFATIGDSVSTQVQAISVTPASNQEQAMTVVVASVAGTSNVGGAIGINTTSAHGLTSGQNVFLTGIGGTTEANNFSSFFGRTNITGPGYWTIIVTSTTSFTLVGSTFVNAWTSGGTVFPALFALSAAQQKAGSVAQDLGRVMALVLNGVRYWGNINIVYDAATVQLSAGGNDISTPICWPASFTSPATPVATEWFLGTWSGAYANGVSGTFNGNGYPQASCFHQNRLVFAGAANSPQEVDFSGSNSFEDFAPSDATTLNVRDSDAMSFNLSSDDQNPIRWMASTAQGLCAGNYSSEWAMTPSGNSEALTPTNFNAQQTSFFGSAAIAPAKIGNAVMYVQRASRKLREMAFFFMAGTFRSNDLTEISEHITLPSLNQIAVQKEGQPLIWGARGDGALVSLIYNRDDVSLSAGWMRHQLGGQSDSLGTIPVVTNFAFIPDPLVTFDQMWMVVKRFINSATIYTIEYMTKISDDSIAQADSFQLDCGATFIGGSPSTVISGLSWLVGETVSVLTDGGIHPNCVVDGTGAITLNYPATKVQIGYAYNSQGQLLRAEAGAADGTSIGKTRRTTRVAMQLHRAGDLAIGTTFDNLIPVKFAQADQNDADTAVPLFSGMIREGLESAYDFESQLCFQQNSPLPGTIQSITSFLEEFDL